MSIHIRVYPQAGSVGYNRTHRRRAQAQNFNFQRNLQLQGMRLQQQLAMQQAQYAPSTVGSQFDGQFGGQFGYNTGIAGGMFPNFGRNAYGAPQLGYPQPSYGQFGGYGQVGGYGTGFPQVAQYNGVNQFGGYGSVDNANSWQFCTTPNGVYGGQYGAGLVGRIGNMFASAFRGW
ncbi:MAG: hypothetical protein H7287_05445 [Thermoleophilia bacterium]|nr:hypothetical protein [Thermoleophilia bacterium]